MTTGLSNTAIQWNGNPIYVDSNSIEFQLGRGERMVRGFSAGGDSVVPVVTDDITTKISRLKFSMANDAQGAQWANQMHNQSAENDFLLSQPTFQASFSSMVMITSPVVPLSSDGMIEVEFEGPPATQSATPNGS